jgi:hypothetical protein
VQGPHESPAVSLPPPSPFALARSHDDTALYQDGRARFSHLLPGRPRFAPPATVTQSAPLADAILVLEDAPITVRYRLETPRVSAATAAEVAHLTAVTEARARAGANLETATVDHANPTWLAAWGVEAAAIAAYDVAPAMVAPGAPLEREDLFVLVRGGLVLTVRWTAPRELANDPVYAMFASVAEATMVWDPERWQDQKRARVWPESRLLGPGMRATPHAALVERARELASFPVAHDERTALVALLSTVVSNAGAPWVAIAATERAAATAGLLAATRDARLRSFVQLVMNEVRSAHDLRGAAMLVARALAPDEARASEAPGLAAQATSSPSQTARVALSPRTPASALGRPRSPSSPPMREAPPKVQRVALPAVPGDARPRVPPPLPTKRF